ncbi:MAG: DUF2079 domain-containing protein [Deltaproteobacteria bacterium]|nr:DUF2079 domain-containing protein [Deltaproteobacteria bacterium]
MIPPGSPVESPADASRSSRSSRSLLRALRALPSLSPLLLLPLVAYGLALAHLWIYFPSDVVEQLLRDRPWSGYNRAPLMLEVEWLLFELVVLCACLAAFLRPRVGSWVRAVRDAALHLAPLGLSPFLLFVDHLGTRLLLQAMLIAGVAAAAAFRVLPESPPRDGRSRWPRRLAPVLALGAATYYVSLAWLQHHSYWTSLYDLGLFVGSMRSTVHGDGILFSPQFGCTFLAEHFSPILLLLAPLYALWQDPMCLQLVQAVSMAAAGYLIFLLADETLEDGWLALAFSFSYLVFPDVLQAQWHGFKMDLLEPPMLVGAFLALRRRRPSWFLLCILLLWATKEDACIYTAILGLYAWLAHGYKRLGPAIVVGSVVYGAIVLGWVITAYSIFQEPGSFYRDFPREQYKFAKHFAHLGPTLPKAMWHALTNPLYSLGYAFSDARFAVWLTLLLPLGFLALAGGVVTLLLLLPVFEMVLSNFTFMFSMDFYYSSAPVAVAYPAAIIGCTALLRRLAASDRWRPRLPGVRVRAAAGAYVVAAVLMLAWSDPQSPFSPANERPAYLRTPRTALLDEVIDSIPPEVPVSATGYLAIHLMNRPRPAMLPFALDRARFAVIDLYRPGFPFPGKLATLLPFTRKMIESPEWGVRRAERGVVLLERGAPRDLNARALENLDAPDFEPEEWEGTNYPNLAVRDPAASNGAFLRVTPNDRRGPGKLFWGPFYPLTPGRYTATFRLAASRESYEAPGRLVATLDVLGNGGAVFAARDLRFSDFAHPDAWQEFPLEFSFDSYQALEFRVHYHDAGTLALDVIRVRPAP